MHFRHVIVAAILAVGLAIQAFVFLGPHADAGTPNPDGGLNIGQITIDHPAKDLPAQTVENPI
jgi:hypothetical protein